MPSAWPSSSTTSGLPRIKQAWPSYATPADKEKWPATRSGLQLLILTSLLSHPDRHTIIALHEKRLRHDVRVARPIIPGGFVKHKIGVTS